MARCVSPVRGHPAPSPRHSSPSCRGLAPTVASPPLRPEPAAWTHSGCPAAAAAGWGRQTWGQGRCGSAGTSSLARAVTGPGASQPRAAPCFRPRGIAGEAEERRWEAGWAVSGRRARLPLPAPRGRSPAQPRGPPANSCCEPTAALAGAPARTCPGEVRPCLLHRASGLGKTATTAGGLVWSRPQARWSHDLILGLRGSGK